MRLSDFAIAWWYYGVAAVAAGVFAYKEARARSEEFREAIERFSLKLPVIGDVIRNSALARFTRTLSTTFAAGVPLVDALTSCAGATGNVVYRNAALRVRDDVKIGRAHV